MKVGFVVVRALRWFSAVLVLALFGASLGTAAVAQEVPEPEPVVADVDLADEFSVEEAPPVPAASTREVDRSELVEPAMVQADVLPAAARAVPVEGWEDGQSSAAVTPGVEVQVGDSPVSVKVFDGAPAVVEDFAVARAMNRRGWCGVPLLMLQLCR